MKKNALGNPCEKHSDIPQFVGEKVKLGDLISKAKVERCGDRFFPVYSMTMHDGIVEQSGRFKKAVASKDTSSYKVVKKNQLVVGFPIDEGVIYVQNHERAGIMSPAYNVWDFDSSRIAPAYLELALHSPQSMAYYAEKLRGTTARRRSLTADGLRALPIVLPSIERQGAVVEVLKGIKGQIADARKTANELDHLVKSRFVEMFGDPCNPEDGKERKRLDSFCELRIGPFGSALHKEDYITGGHPLVNPSHIVNGMVKPDSNLTIDEEKYESLAVYHLLPGDVVLGRRGEIGRCAVVDKSGMICGTGSMILRPSQEIRSDYLQRVVSFPSFSRALENNAVGVTMKNLNAAIVGSAEIFLPELAEQDAFIEFVSQVDKLRFATQQQIDKLETLKKSLMQEYFG